MTDLECILKLWSELEGAGSDFVLATIVAVEGSSYRKPGALMLLPSDGRRAGTVSGGCLEAEVASRAWWLTANGPTVRRYSTAEDDGDHPFGSGCGGSVFLLLERRLTAAPLLEALARTFKSRTALSVATILDSSQMVRRAFAHAEPYIHEAGTGPEHDDPLQQLAARSLAARTSLSCDIPESGTNIRAWAHYRPSRPALAVFGAGDDAGPLVRMAKEMGWLVSVADGRGHLAARTRFPHADEMHVLSIDALPASSADESLWPFRALRKEDAAVLMTHSFEQDAKVLARLLSSTTAPGYIGVLGPRRRTRELLREAARLLDLPQTEALTEEWMGRLHAPTGLDLGGRSPETIALSVLAEIQKTFAAATALSLRDMPADAGPVIG
jgi:xanthine/CO dehydrogenase XdhC/CoxF family maturation factor